MHKPHNHQKDKNITEEILDKEMNPEEAIVESVVGEENDASENGTDNLAEQLEAEKQKNEELKDSYLRLMAEYDNYRKRTLREKADLIKSAGENILSGLLPVIDDFERGLDLMKKSAEKDEEKVNLEGVELIYNKFISFLNAQGVKSIETIGKDFDTEYHEAVTTIPAPSLEMKGKIIDCILKGYTLNDKVIRFAKVVVGE
jgi:molecular chaperone GrpE